MSSAKNKWLPRNILLCEHRNINPSLTSASVFAEAVNEPKLKKPFEKCPVTFKMFKTPVAAKTKHIHVYQRIHFKMANCGSWKQ